MARLLAAPCACGGTVLVSTSVVHGVRAHNRTERHRRWSERLEPGSDRVVVPAMPPHVYEEHLDALGAARG